MAASPHRVAPRGSPAAGQKRKAPSLLPAFEPVSSSPALPRPANRLNASPTKHGTVQRECRSYPSPIPTSSTLVPTSSPHPVTNTRPLRPPLHRAISALSERVPLGNLPAIELSENGEATLLGRSSNASHYQLSTNKNISRIHVRAMYIAAASPSDISRVQIECTGWNGVKVHCQGKAWDLHKGDTFTSETEDADIIVDVQDARVSLTWPKGMKVLTPTDSDRSSWEGENSPTRQRSALRGHGSRSGISGGSPLRQQHRLASPLSPTPAVQATTAAASGHMLSNSPIAVPVQIYEDEPQEDEKDQAPHTISATQASTQILSQPQLTATQDTVSSLSDPPNESFSDHNEENDPIISSFSGPFGPNLDARMSNITTRHSPLSVSPEARRKPLEPLKEESISPQRQDMPKRRRLTKYQDPQTAAVTADAKDTRLFINHIINQLAYSALSATPLSTLFESASGHLKHACSTAEDSLAPAKLESVLLATPCIGAVERSGKDAAGKRLESEFYYIPEKDDDEKRRELVMGLGGRGLRNCRKSHKQYFWRKPK